MKQAIIGWSRDCHGVVTDRHIKHIANAITTFAGSGRADQDGLGNTTPYIITIFEL